MCALVAFALLGCTRSGEGATSTNVPSTEASTTSTSSTTLTTSPPPNVWPSEITNNYLSGCRRGASASMSMLSIDLYCTCTLEALQRKLTASEFLDAETKLVQGEASGIDITTIASGCQLGA